MICVKCVPLSRASNALATRAPSVMPGLARACALAASNCFMRTSKQQEMISSSSRSVYSKLIQSHTNMSLIFRYH
eukprot:10858-Heterococcus_DN1.PRE.1